MQNRYDYYCNLGKVVSPADLNDAGYLRMVVLIYRPEFNVTERTRQVSQEQYILSGYRTAVVSFVINHTSEKASISRYSCKFKEKIRSCSVSGMQFAY